MKMETAIVGATIAAVAVILLAPGFATYLGVGSDSKASTYNEENSSSTQYITISLGGSQYSGAVTSDVPCHTVIQIDGNSRVTKYYPDYDSDPVTVAGVDHYVTKIVEFDVTVTPPSGSSLPAYTLNIDADDTTKMHGSFYLSYWTDPDDTTTRHNEPFPKSPSTTGISITGLTTSSLKICMYVNIDSLLVDNGSEEPYLSSLPTPLDDVAFVFTAGVSS